MYGLILIGIGSQNNFGLRVGFKCLDLLFLAILVVLRAGIILYLVCYNAPDMYNLLVKTYFLNHDNWWVHPDEPFFTNASKFNALVTWGIWISLRPAIFLLMYLSPIVVVSLLFKFKEQVGSWGELFNKIIC